MAIRIYNDAILKGTGGGIAASADCCCGGCPEDGTTCTNCGDRVVNVSGMAGTPCSCGNGSYQVSPNWFTSCTYSDTFGTGCFTCDSFFQLIEDDIYIDIFCEEGLWYVRVSGNSWGAGCQDNFSWLSDGRSGTCPPTGSYNMSTDEYADFGGSDCSAPTVSLSLP